MKSVLIFILGFISYVGLLEYIEYKDYKNWNIATFKYREDIFGENTISKRNKIIEEKIEKPYDRMLAVLLKRPSIGESCLFIMSDKKCPFDFLKFDADKLKYNVYCFKKNEVADETMAENVDVLKAQKIKDNHKDRDCVMILQNEEEL